MPLLKCRQWRLANGDRWTTWFVQWVDRRGVPHAERFDGFSEALGFFVELAIAIRRTKARGITCPTIARLVDVFQDDLAIDSTCDNGHLDGRDE
jgi:hypothetical protein